MYLAGQTWSNNDERIYGDSRARNPDTAIELSHTSFGSLSATDTKDYFILQPGAGNFALFVTADASNGFETQAFNFDFDVKITDSAGVVLLNSDLYDPSTRAIAFSSPTAGATYYVEITNTSGKAISYAATMLPPNAPSNANVMTGDDGANSMVGTAGPESMSAMGGDDTVMGGAGADSIDGGSGSNYLRGEDGNDKLVGGAGFDDINGNMGDDTAAGGLGDDWVVGGKDNDQLYGEAGGDVVWGNLGNDSLDGGDGNDQVRGGQGNDLVMGGAGDDYVSGDRGNDTIHGGSGADLFHSFGDAGIDRVLDFNAAEGDRVMLDPGTVYTVAQMFQDTVITMDGGAQMTLVGVTLSALPAGWIFLG
ncbi:MAG: alkaline metalloproteinase [Phenylobacterium sp.]|nr:alkaline metalloproteinase [Phenylobacterium sp.]